MHSHIDDLLDPTLLARSLDAGYVREQTHPTLPLRIFNYAEKAVFEREWNEVTLQCRGLVIDPQGRILARPYAKFFNYSEHPECTFGLDDTVVVTDKLDGSLGILYPLPDGGHAIATRGSFASDQALHATKVWQERYADTASVKSGVTYLFEIIFRRTGSSVTTEPWTTWYCSAASTSPPAPRCSLTSCRGTVPVSTPSPSTRSPTRWPRRRTPAPRASCCASPATTTP
ncbi:RNA ligase [Kitasatospora sp. NPDC098663]|uniref:RNA ligase n=1 Tax=Kitasatospora sp. NPDC098663 TaxID=3364096 RepID=UPI0037FFB5AE